MPAINQEINVIINALVKKLQDVRDLNKEITALKSNDGKAVVIDERISANARASIGDVKQLSSSVAELQKHLDADKPSKFSHAIGLLSSTLQGLAAIGSIVTFLSKFEGSITSAETKVHNIVQTLSLFKAKA